MRLVQNIFLPNAATIAGEVMGAFEKRHVQLVTRFTKSSLDQRAELLSGESDVAVTALDNLFAWNDGVDAFVAVAQIETTTSLPVYLSGGATLGELASRERVRVVVDSTASGFGIALVDLVESLGVGRDRQDVIGAGGVNERLAVLIDGDGDIALLAPFVAEAAAKAGLHRVTSLEDHYPVYPGLVVVVSQHRVDEIGAALAAYLAALGAGRTWLGANPEDGVAALMATGLPEPAARAQLALCGSGPLTVSRPGFALLRELRSRQQLLPELPCEFDDFVTRRFLEES